MKMQQSQTLQRAHRAPRLFEQLTTKRVFMDSSASRRPPGKACTPSAFRSAAQPASAHTTARTEVMFSSARADP
jgi:hypothetical protein